MVIVYTKKCSLYGRDFVLYPDILRDLEGEFTCR